jgi:biopolymer transport protein ExbD
MAGGSGGGRTSTGRKKARIEIIPLIDVIFFLLATFILFTLSLNKSNGLPVSLPNSETGEPRDPSGTATVTVTVDGTLAWEKEPVTAEEFLTRLKVFHLQHPEPDAHILLNGDADAQFGAAVVYVMDEARKAGIKRVLIETHMKPLS